MCAAKLGVADVERAGHSVITERLPAYRDAPERCVTAGRATGRVHTWTRRIERQDAERTGAIGHMRRMSQEPYATRAIGHRSHRLEEP